MRVVVECSPCRAWVVVVLSLVGYFTSRYLTPVQSVFAGTINDEDCDLQGRSSVAGWLATVSGHSAAS